MLTNDQQRAYDGLRSFLSDQEKRIALLSGNAGTGKGYLVQYLITQLANKKIFCSSTTNKAASVQMEQASSAGANPDGFGTIYSLLGLRLMPDGEVKTIRQAADGRFSDYDIVIVDEASMANDNLISHLVNALKTSKTKVILVGDPNQLPPVKSEAQISPAFEIADVAFRLNEVVRHEGPILQICNSIKEAIENDAPLPAFETVVDRETGEGAFVLDRETWKRWMIKGFTSPDYATDGKKFKAIAWRNATVDRLNRFIRRALYGEEADSRFLVGEPVLTAAPILEYEELIAPTDATGRIVAAEQSIHDDPVVLFYGNFKVWRLMIDFDNGNTAEVNVLDESERMEFSKVLDTIAAEARSNSSMWSTFHSFKDAFADIRYSHALTSHRSQGSTFENVFVDVDDIKANPNRKEMLRSLYVACSRASKNLVLYV